jgi:hypothetical protein
VSFLTLFGGRPVRRLAGADLTTALEAYYRLQGNGTDESGNTRTLTMSGAGYGAAKIGNGLFTGSGSRSGGVGLTDSGPLSVSAWVKPSLVDESVVVLRAGGLAVKVTSDTAAASVCKRSSEAAALAGGTTDPLTPDEWSHVVVVEDAASGVSTVVRVYVNGVLAATTNTFTRDAGQSSATLEALANDGGSYDVPIDEVALYSIALSAEQVAALYNGGAGFDPTA